VTPKLDGADPMTAASTGTIYGLVDPRDGILKYIGQTKRTPAVRVRNGYAPRVTAWLAELRAARLAPSIIRIREGVPVDDLLVAEAEEITRVIAAGGTLLNEQVTALGRKLLSERHAAERKATEHAAWAEVASAALAILGGPLPPGDLPLIEIPDEAWHFISTGGPARLEHAESLFPGRQLARGSQRALCAPASRTARARGSRGAGVGLRAPRLVDSPRHRE
jgi:hypothetical protein